jgi:hypothetical protein
VAGIRGLLLWGDTVRSAALRHEIPLAIIGSLLLAEVDGRRVVLTSFLERDRVTRALPDAEVLDFFDFGWKELVAGGMSRRPIERRSPAWRAGSTSTRRSSRAISRSRLATACATTESF